MCERLLKKGKHMGTGGRGRAGGEGRREAEGEAGVASCKSHQGGAAGCFVGCTVIACTHAYTYTHMNKRTCSQCHERPCEYALSA